MLRIVFAATSIAVNSVVQNPTTRTVTVGYSLSGDPAVVTMGSVQTNGAAMAESDLLAVSGDIDRLLQPGSHSLEWHPPVSARLRPMRFTSR